MTGQRTFAAAVGANDRHEFAGHDLKINPIQRRDRIVVRIYINMFKPFGFNHRLHSSPLRIK